MASVKGSDKVFAGFWNLHKIKNLHWAKAHSVSLFLILWNITIVHYY